jgi:hypothetical protein
MDCKLKKQFDKFMKHLETLAAEVGDMIRFEVRGRSFSTTKAKLLRHKDTFFYGMLNSGLFHPNAEGCYVIDRYVSK